MGIVGKKMQGQNMSPGDLSGLLGGQAEQAEEGQPGLMGNLSRILDRNADGSVMDDLSRIAGGLFNNRN
jgi:hypothetical protein